MKVNKKVPEVEAFIGTLIEGDDQQESMLDMNDFLKKFNSNCENGEQLNKPVQMMKMGGNSIDQNTQGIEINYKSREKKRRITIMQQNIKDMFSSHPDKLHRRAEKQVKKRKRNDISRDNKGKYQCQQCDYEARRSSCLKKHVEAIHQGVRYPCNQCSYKATETGNLQKHVDSIC